MVGVGWKGETAMSEPEATAVGIEYIANVCALTVRRIRQLSGEGHITRNGDGKYPFPQAVREYCEYSREDKSKEQLQIKKLGLDCKLKTQDLHEKRSQMKADIEQDCWEEFQDMLGEYRNLLSRLQFKPDELEQLNKVLDDARTNINARAVAKLPIHEPEE